MSESAVVTKICEAGENSSYSSTYYFALPLKMAKNNLIHFFFTLSYIFSCTELLEDSQNMNTTSVDSDTLIRAQAFISQP